MTGPWVPRGEDGGLRMRRGPCLRTGAFPPHPKSVLRHFQKKCIHFRISKHLAAERTNLGPEGTSRKLRDGPKKRNSSFEHRKLAGRMRYQLGRTYFSEA